MLISDWSSDVCSSDLLVPVNRLMAFRKPLPAALAQSLPVAGITEDRSIAVPEIVGAEITRYGVARSMYQPFLFTSSSESFSKPLACSPASARKSVVSGKSVSYRVYLGGCRLIQKKNKKTY